MADRAGIKVAFHGANHQIEICSLIQFVTISAIHGYYPPTAVQLTTAASRSYATEKRQFDGQSGTDAGLAPKKRWRFLARNGSLAFSAVEMALFGTNWHGLRGAVSRKAH